jgi:hypothetical protein
LKKKGTFAATHWSRTERTQLASRGRAPLERLEAAGRPWGRPRWLDDALSIAKVLALRRRGRSLRQIAAAYDLPLSTIGDSLRRAAAR